MATHYCSFCRDEIYDRSYGYDPRLCEQCATQVADLFGQSVGAADYCSVSTEGLTIAWEDVIATLRRVLTPERRVTVMYEYTVPMTVQDRVLQNVLDRSNKLYEALLAPAASLAE